MDVVTDERAKPGSSLTSERHSVGITLEQGRFSDNAFFLIPGVEKTVEFMSLARRRRQHQKLVCGWSTSRCMCSLVEPSDTGHRVLPLPGFTREEP